MQSAAELMARVRQIRLRTRRLVSSALAGGYKSSFRGSGIEFEEVRAYQLGDEVRAIDWKVTARKNEPHIKTYREDRALTLHFVVDTGPSMDFGTRRVTKRELAAEFAALLSYVALGNRDQVGLTLFAGETGLHLDPGRSSAHMSRLVREVIAAPTAEHPGPSDLIGQLSERMRGHGRHTLLFLVTDFHGWLEPGGEDLRDELRRRLLSLASRHDVIAVPVSDPFEVELPDAGLLELREPSGSGRTRLVDSSSRRVRRAWSEAAAVRRKNLSQLLSRARVGVIPLSTARTVADPVVRFFEARARGLTPSLDAQLASGSRASEGTP
jgi:uncharacterized protein (DUF58 family)